MERVSISTTRKRAEALLAGEKELLEMVVAGRPLQAVLNSLCEVVYAAAAGGCFSSVILLDRIGTKVGFVAAPGLPSGYKEALEGRPVNCAGGPCGMAIALNTEVIVPDVASDTRWEKESYPAVALECGVKSCWSSPILSSIGESLGSFAITRRVTGEPTSFHQALIEQFAHIASIAIERTRSEDALRRSEASLAEAQHLSSTGSYWWHAPTDEIKGRRRAIEFSNSTRLSPLRSSRCSIEPTPTISPPSKIKSNGCGYFGTTLQTAGYRRF
jgi:GAF domain-containing protein